MTVGTASLLYGVHQFIWHPITVLLAWIRLYGLPTWRELVCIVVHDWGYAGCLTMDGPDGSRHPEFGARIAKAFAGREAYYECLLHSRRYARRLGREPSKLCWADKLSMMYDPDLWYLLRANLTDEIFEYRTDPEWRKMFPLSLSDREWLRAVKKYLWQKSWGVARDVVLVSRRTDR